MVHKHHTFTLIIGAIFGVLLSVGIAFFTFTGISQLPFFTKNAEKAQKEAQANEAFLETVANNIAGDLEDAGNTRLNESGERITISELRGQVIEADVRGFTMRVTLQGSAQSQDIRVDYASSALLSAISSAVPAPGQVETNEYLLNPNEIEPNNVVVVYTTAQVDSSTTALVARQVKQIQ